MRIFAALLLVVLPAVAQEAQGEKVDLKHVLDLPYKTGGSEYEKERCKLDLYLPPGRKDFPVVVWFHGGGLKGGDKAAKASAQFGRRLAAEGIAVASANYRLSPKAKFPAYTEDAAAAVAWVHRNIADHGGDPAKLFVSGHSAGGYLAAIITLDESYLEKMGLSTKILAGSFPVSGQMDSHSTIKGERGENPKERIVNPSAPLHHARKDAPPIFLIAGGNDLPGRAQLNQDMHDALRKAGHPEVSLLIEDGRNHGTIITQVGRKDDPVAERILAFIRDRSSSK